ncbi:hypothetical protein, partial [Actinomadura sp. KC216]|uniref:hypothetical protein n=1 Tax=Actinomadura sp. KC216 TaxID=2530370 RepID=UPI001A9FB407
MFYWILRRRHKARIALIVATLLLLALIQPLVSRSSSAATSSRSRKPVSNDPKPSQLQPVHMGGGGGCGKPKCCKKKCCKKKCKP